MVNFADAFAPGFAEDDDPFPLGDGVADTAAEVQCPWCWQWVDLHLDPGSGTIQEYTEDCAVCCRPWRVAVAYGADGTAEVRVEPEAD